MKADLRVRIYDDGTIKVTKFDSNGREIEAPLVLLPPPVATRDNYHAATDPLLPLPAARTSHPPVPIPMPRPVVTDSTAPVDNGSDS